jgi:predicted DNA-binding WGR domain protein
MPLAHLHRIDPEANMARFYCIDVAATLFGDVSVLRTWGRIGTHGRTSIETCATVEDAERAASQTLRQKMRRGYLPAGQMLPPDLAVCDLSGLSLKPAFKLGTGLDGDPLVDDVCLHDRTRRELNVSRRDRAGNRPKHDEVLGDDGAFNTT